MKVLRSLLFLVAVASCGRNMDQVVLDPFKNVVGGFENITDGQGPNLQLNTSDGTVVDLRDADGKPTIILFSGEWCLTCKEEHNHLKQYFLESPDLLTKINIYTIFIRVNQSKADTLAKLWGIDWQVAFKPDLELIKQFCPNALTPCAVVHSPSQGIVYQKAGPFDKETFVGWTQLED